MKVDVAATTYIPIKHLYVGDTFMYAGDYYIKTASSNDEEMLSVKLTNGNLLHLPYDSLVNPVKLKIVIDKDGDQHGSNR